MKDYELLYIVSGGLTEAEATKVSDDVGNALMKLGGKAEEDSQWGRRKLAYEIGKDDHGWYVVTRFSMDPAKLDDFQKALNLNSKIIRTVLVNANEVPTPEEAAKAKEALEKTEAERDEAEDAKPRASTAAPTGDAGDVPEEMKKTVKKAAPKPEAKKVEEVEEPEEAKPPADDKERQAKLDEKLGEILND